jgi:hypothetical protein
VVTSKINYVTRPMCVAEHQCVDFHVEVENFFWATFLPQPACLSSYCGSQTRQFVFDLQTNLFVPWLKVRYGTRLCEKGNALWTRTVCKWLCYRSHVSVWISTTVSLYKGNCHQQVLQHWLAAVLSLGIQQITWIPYQYQQTHNNCNMQT